MNVTSSAATAAASLPLWRRRLESLIVGLAGGALLILTTRFDLGILTGLGYALLLAPAVVERWRSPLTAYLSGLWIFVIPAHLALGTYGWYVAALLPVVLTIGFPLQAVFAGSLRRFTSLPAWLILPIATGAGEWTRRFVDPGSYAMYKVGTGLAPWPVLIQISDLVGVFGLSMLVMVVWGALIEALRAWLAPEGPASRRSALRGAAAAAAVVVIIVGYGSIRLGTLETVDGPRVAVVQPSLDHAAELTPSVVEQQKQMTARWIRPGSADLLVWPENAILAPYEEHPEYQQVVSWLARSREMPFLVGVQSSDPSGTRPTNTAILVEVDGTVSGRYDKVVLFPFTERRMFPLLERVWPWLSEQFVKLTLMAWHGAPDGWGGTRAVVIRSELGGEPHAFWPPICYEIFYPRLGRQARRDGAEFFVNLTSEGWLGWSASHDMIGAAVLRSVENRVGMVRAANTGVSAFIGPDGRVDAQLRGQKGRLHLDQGHLTRPVRISSSGPTVYSRLGGIIDPLGMIAWLILAGFGIVRSRRQRR